MSPQREYNYHILPNGIRVVHKQTDTLVAHCGIIINTGSRDEQPDEQGIAHFIEHIIFKGTKKRKAFHVLSRLENIGGDLNAFTTKEETVVHASFLYNYYERTIELISDIVFNSNFPEKEIAKEKDVVMDEINAYKDSPAEKIFEDFDALVFEGHPLARDILGMPKTVRKLTRKKIDSFIKNNYHTDQIVLCSVGKISFEKLLKLVYKYFEPVRENRRVNSRLEFKGYRPETKAVKKKTYQTHCVMGNIAYGLAHERKIPMILLNNVLGGPTLNSRLTLNIREKYGFCYNLESHYIPFSDTGLFTIYLGTVNGYLERIVRLIEKELNILKNRQLGNLQLQRAKQQIMGQLAISQESNLTEMLAIGKSYLVYNKVDTIEEIHKKIETVTASELLEIANEIFAMDKFSMIIYLSR